MLNHAITFFVIALIAAIVITALSFAQVSDLVSKMTASQAAIAVLALLVRYEWSDQRCLNDA